MGDDNKLYKKIYMTTIFYVDWDDTVFPTFWSNSNLINMSNKDSVKNYKLYFIELDKTVSNLFINLKKYGEIYIVTNANIKWIKACLNILTITRDIIMNGNIRIVSARDIYSQNTGSPTEWKINTFRDIINKKLENLPQGSQCNTFLNIISIGDAQYEYMALLNLDNFFKTTNKKINYLLKSVKFIEKPNFDIVIDQIELLKKNTEQIVNKVGYIDLKFVD